VTLTTLLLGIIYHDKFILDYVMFNNYSPYEFPLQLCPCLSQFLRCTEILVENKRFNLPHLRTFFAHTVMIPLEFRRDLWQHNTRLPGLSYGRHCLRDPTFSYSTKPDCYRQTNRETDEYNM